VWRWEASVWHGQSGKHFRFRRPIRESSPLHGCCFCWALLTANNLIADLTGIQTLQMMLNCMCGVWAVEVEQEAFVSEFTSVHRSRSRAAAQRCHELVITGSREPQRQQEPRGVPATEARPPCAEGRDTQLGPAPQTLPYRRACMSALCA
jgi:hypothetical protein